MKQYTINFVGNFVRGYVGEVADEVHLANEMENLGHTVRRIPRDEWREHVIQGKEYPNVPKELKADVNIICKWPHFYDGSFASKLREESGGPVFYWVWDFMYDDYNNTLADWHVKMIQGSDLYLGNDVRSYVGQDVPSQKLYYFPFDVTEKKFDRVILPKKYDVTFFGSYIKKGDRAEWMKKINQQFPIKVFSWNFEEWIKEGFDA